MRQEKGRSRSGELMVLSRRSVGIRRAPQEERSGTHQLDARLALLVLLAELIADEILSGRTPETPVNGIKQEGKSPLDPSALVEASRPSESPLHSIFEWNDGKAGRKFRTGRARRLLRKRPEASVEAR